jgi:ABC-type uncharacterized transport system substrate-binding protein
VQTPQRYRAAKLKNDREAQEQKIREQEAQQQLKIDAQKAEILLEIAATALRQLQSNNSAKEREMIIHTLIPPLLQLSTTKGLQVMLPALQTNEEPTQDK